MNFRLGEGATDTEDHALAVVTADAVGDECGAVADTFQRRVRRWRLAEWPEKEVFFTQDHKPGEEWAVDWTDMGGLGIMMVGPFLRSFLEFPPSQKPGSFGVGKALESIQNASQGGGM